MRSVSNKQVASNLEIFWESICMHMMKMAVRNVNCLDKVFNVTVTNRGKH